jgi:hypothetical protein
MKRHFAVALLAVLTVVPLNAQAPKGWKLRVDRSMSASDPDAAGDIKFVATDSGFHAMNPKAAVYWNPANTATGNYTIKGTFKLLRTSGHSEYYGLIFGGSDLEGPAQSYVYFMVESEGTWLIKSRNGNSTAQIASSGSPSDAVKRADASGTSTNALEVHIMPDKIQFLVNGKVVNTMPKSAMTAKTDGIYGMRVNHMLEVQVDGFALSKM